jgi:hypothetical protein
MVTPTFGLSSTTTGAAGGGGVAVTVMLAVLVLDPVAFVAFRVTVYVPALVKVCDGFRTVEVPPSPKVHAQLVGVPVEVSVNWTASGAVPVVGDQVKLATGAGTGAVTTIVPVLVLDPVAFFAVSVTV